MPIYLRRFFLKQIEQVLKAESDALSKNQKSSNRISPGTRIPVGRVK